MWYLVHVLYLLFFSRFFLLSIAVVVVVVVVAVSVASDVVDAVFVLQLLSLSWTGSQLQVVSISTVSVESGL